MLSAPPSINVVGDVVVVVVVDVVEPLSRTDDGRYLRRLQDSLGARAGEGGHKSSAGFNFLSSPSSPSSPSSSSSPSNYACATALGWGV